MPTHWNEESMLQQPEAAASAKPDKKSVNMPIGVPDYTLRDEPRDVPVTEPPVWPINKDLKFVGKSPERWDGLCQSHRAGALHIRHTTAGNALREICECQRAPRKGRFCGHLRGGKSSGCARGTCD